MSNNRSERWRRGYEASWGAAFDPLAVRISTREDGIDVEAVRAEPLRGNVRRLILRRTGFYRGRRRLIARDGHVIVFKGPALSKDELDAGQLAAEQCGLQTWDVFDYGLPMGPDELSHTLVVYRRVP